MHTQLLQIGTSWTEYKYGLLAFMTAFAVAMVMMPPLIKFFHKFKFFDNPDARKEHSVPIPTMGGIAAIAGMCIGCLLWFHFTNDAFVISFFFSVALLLAVGIMDDLKHMPAKYKLAIQVAISFLIASGGVRITSFNGMFGLHELPISAQYSLTILVITGITNAYNLIDGIDGLAGGLGFMGLIITGVFLSLSNDSNTAIIAFALGGGILGFLYYNFNPAKIFMGDTGSLVLGFVISVLCIKLIQLNTDVQFPVFPHAPVFAMSIVFIPVFDTIRVFSIRIWQGRSPFSPDKNHIHHLLTNNGWSHGFSAKLICGLNALIVIVGYFLKDIHQWTGFMILFIILLITVFIFQRLKVPKPPALAATKQAEAA